MIGRLTKLNDMHSSYRLILLNDFFFVCELSVSFGFIATEEWVNLLCATIGKKTECKISNNFIRLNEEFNKINFEQASTLGSRHSGSMYGMSYTVNRDRLHWMGFAHQNDIFKKKACVRKYTISSLFHLLHKIIAFANESYNKNDHIYTHAHNTLQRQTQKPTSNNTTATKLP